MTIQYKSTQSMSYLYPKNISLYRSTLLYIKLSVDVYFIIYIVKTVVIYLVIDVFYHNLL